MRCNAIHVQTLRICLLLPRMGEVGRGTGAICGALHCYSSSSPAGLEGIGDMEFGISVVLVAIDYKNYSNLA